MNAFSAVYWKEVRENLRDRRTLINALITGPLLGPVMFITLMNIMVNKELAKSDQPNTAKLSIGVAKTVIHGWDDEFETIQAEIEQELA